MAMPAELVDGVIGVDTHRDTLTAAAVTHLGGVLGADHHQRRCHRLPAAARLRRTHLPGRRCWAVEGAGSFGAGLAGFLPQHGERVMEVGRPRRPALAAAPRATRWTRSEPPARRWARTVGAWRSHGGVASGKHCGYC
jgi:transposase